MRSTQGLFDLQVNGYAGVDFNDVGIDSDRLDHALASMQAAGVTGCLPTIITAHWRELEDRLAALDRAVANSRLGAEMVPGYHLEGPFLRAEEGYAGCHPIDAMRDPDAEKVLALSARLSRPILMTTMAPERAGAPATIKLLRENGITVCVGHTAALFDDIARAVEAGASCSTHLGNGLPGQMHKLENTVLAQLAAKGLAACFIADGHHISPQALRALVQLKGVLNSVLVTDAVAAAHAPAGRYSFAGMTVERDRSGVVRVPEQANLAGSALQLDQAVRNVVAWNVGTFADAIVMAAENPRRLIEKSLVHFGICLPDRRLVWSADLIPTLQ